MQSRYDGTHLQYAGLLNQLLLYILAATAYKKLKSTVVTIFFPSRTTLPVRLGELSNKFEGAKAISRRIVCASFAHGGDTGANVHPRAPVERRERLRQKLLVILLRQCTTLSQYFGLWLGENKIGCLRE